MIGFYLDFSLEEAIVLVLDVCFLCLFVLEFTNVCILI